MRLLLTLLALLAAAGARGQESGVMDYLNYYYFLPFGSKTNVDLGYLSTTTQQDSQCFGIQNTSTGVGCNLFGDYNSDGGYNYVSIIGVNVTATSANRCYIGNASYPYQTVASGGVGSLSPTYGGNCYNSSATAITNKLAVNIQLDITVAAGTVGYFNNAGTCVGTNTALTATLTPILQPGGYITNTSATVAINGAWAF
jgi:hypothetical protein